MNIPNDLTFLLPVNKHDLDRARRLTELRYEDIQPLVPGLLSWLQDFNWPVAKVLAPWIASMGNLIRAEICQVLKTNDGMWKYWIMVCVIKESRELRHSLAEELRRISEEPTADEKAEELDVVASEILGNAC